MMQVSPGRPETFWFRFPYVGKRFTKNCDVLAFISQNKISSCIGVISAHGNNDIFRMSRQHCRRGMQKVLLWLIAYKSKRKSVL